MNKNGFTLVELIAVVALLGLIAIITTPAYDTISSKIKERNYNSKKSVIENQLKDYIENYMKDDLYNGSVSKTICFSTRFLIQNGIITSDDEKEEYILNDVTNEKYSGTSTVAKAIYDVSSRKIKIYIKGETGEPSSCSITYS